MSKYANSGEMRVPIIVEHYDDTETTSNGIQTNKWVNVYGEGKCVKAKWVNVHGTDVYQALSMELREPATLTMRFSPRITQECRIIKAEDIGKNNQKDLYYEIISLDDIEERHMQLEIKVQRWRNAK